MKKLWDLGWKIYHKNEEVWNYLIFGFLAFVVNMVAYWACAKVIGADKDHAGLVLIATAFAWVVAVIFAYWTNHSFVFKSKTNGLKELWKEFAAFVSARIITGLMELAIMYVMTDMLDINDMFSKLVCNVVVIITNYIFSKLWIFKKKKTDVTEA